jgi:hypothetical protein
MGFGKPHRHGQNSTAKNKNKEGDKQQRQQQKETNYHDGKLIVKKQGLQSGGTREKSGTDKKSPNVVIKKQGLRGGGTLMNTSTIRSTSHSKSKAAVNTNNNHKSNKNENENENENEIATKKSFNRNHDHDQHTASTTTMLEDALSLVTAAFPGHADDDRDNAGASAAEKAEAYLAQRKRASRKENIVMREVQQWQEGILDMDYDDGTATTATNSTTQSMSNVSSTSSSMNYQQGISMSTTTSGDTSTSGATFWNECMAFFFLSSANFIEANCSPAALRRKAACFDYEYGQDPINEPAVEVHHYGEPEGAYADAGPTSTIEASTSGSSTTTKQALLVPTDAANAGQHRHPASAAASRRSPNRIGAVSTVCLIEPPGGDQSFGIGKSHGSRSRDSRVRAVTSIVQTTRKTGAANAGQHERHSSVAASRKSSPLPSSSKHRNGAESVECLIERHGGDQSFYNGNSRDSRSHGSSEGTVGNSSTTSDGDTTASTFLENDSHHAGNGNPDPDAELHRERVHSHSDAQTYGEPARANANVSPTRANSSRTTTCTKQALVPGPVRVTSKLKTTTDAGQHLVSVRSTAASIISASSSSGNRSACLIEPKHKSFHTGCSNGSRTVGSSTGTVGISNTGDTSTILDDDTDNSDGDGDDEQRDGRNEVFITSMDRSRSMTSMDSERVI